MGLCGCCGAPAIIASNIDIVDYFELCAPCQIDYDNVADQLHIDFVKEDEDNTEIPEFWLEN